MGERKIKKQAHDSSLGGGKRRKRRKYTWPRNHPPIPRAHLWTSILASRCCLRSANQSQGAGSQHLCQSASSNNRMLQILRLNYTSFEAYDGVSLPASVFQCHQQRQQSVLCQLRGSSCSAVKLPSRRIDCCIHSPRRA